MKRFVLLFICGLFLFPTGVFAGFVTISDDNVIGKRYSVSDVFFPLINISYKAKGVSQQKPEGVPWACACSFDFEFNVLIPNAAGVSTLTRLKRQQTFYFNFINSAPWPFIVGDAVMNNNLELRIDSSKEGDNICNLVLWWDEAPKVIGQNVVHQTVSNPAEIQQKMNAKFVSTGGGALGGHRYFQFNSPPDCKIFYPPTDICCCIPEETGTLGRKNICQKGRGTTADPKSCSDLIDETDISNNPLGGYRPFPMPASKNCKDLEQEQGTYNPDKQELGLTLGKLQADAAMKLNPFKFIDLPSLIGRFLKILPMYMGMIAMVMYIWAGVLWMTASGNSERTTKAKVIVVWTSLGVVAMLASYMLISFVFKSVLQINI